MVNIPSKAKHAYDRNSLENINQSTHGILTNQNITSINHPPVVQSTTTSNHTPSMTASNAGRTTVTTSTPQLSNIVVPTLQHPISKGQKANLFQTSDAVKITANFGWNTSNSQCDVDVSAFLLGEDGKVIGDSWFVFYGQETSPDNSVVFNAAAHSDREIITIDFSRLNPSVSKIVFVLTINEAFEKQLNFGMMKDAYVRILNASNSTELVSFQMTEYYDNVISMMIGEIYKYNNNWKFNAIGNGVTRDLAGLCDLYGVQTI